MNKIVLTGGPCGGKSSIVDFVVNDYDKKGYDFHFVDETATNLFSNKFNTIKVGDEEISKFDFQTVLFLMQFIKEYNTETSIIEEDAGDKSIILCDRGLLDGKAYMEDIDYEKILKKFGIVEDKLVKTYSTVLHLVSMYLKDKEFFASERPFAVNYAADIDYYLKEAWSNCQNKFIIPTTDSIEEKRDMVYKYIDSSTDYRTPMLHDFYNETYLLYMKEYLSAAFSYFEKNVCSDDKVKVLKMRSYAKEKNII